MIYQIRRIHRPESGGKVVADTGLVRRVAGSVALSAGNGVVTIRYVVEDAGGTGQTVGVAARELFGGSQLVKDQIRLPLPRIGVLPDQCHDAGESRRGRRRTAYAREGRLALTLTARAIDTQQVGIMLA